MEHRTNPHHFARSKRQGSSRSSASASACHGAVLMFPSHAALCYFQRARETPFGSKTAPETPLSTRHASTRHTDPRVGPNADLAASAAASALPYCCRCQSPEVRRVTNDPAYISSEPRYSLAPSPLVLYDMEARVYLTEPFDVMALMIVRALSPSSTWNL